MTRAQRPGFLALLTAVVLTCFAVAATVGAPFANEDSAASSNKIVSIGGSVTEIVFALGQEHRLVARDTTSVYPEAAHDLPDVGYIRALSPEGVMSMSPDLILMLEGSGPPEAVEVLKKAGIKIVDVPEGHTAQAILDKVAAVGDALGMPEEAKSLSLTLKEDLASAQDEAKTQTGGAKVLFLFAARGGRLLAGGNDTAADGILELAGAENAVSDFSGYKQISDEAIIAANPDVILMMTRAGHQGPSAAELFQHPALALTSAGKNQNLIKMRGQYLLGFGPRTAAAIRELAEKLNNLES